MRKMSTPPLWLASWTIAFALAVLPAAAFAQGNTSSIRGVVKDADGPIADAVVVAVDVASGFRRSAKSGADGRTWVVLGRTRVMRRTT